jgi:hypothetical protein
VPHPGDPTVEIRAGGELEQGISTEYGVVFLGRTAQSGPIEITAYFGDGASVERGVAEPLGGGLFTTTTEIRLPSVPLAFEVPAGGSQVLVAGRRDGAAWETTAEVASDPRVTGLILRWNDELSEIGADLAGAGVYRLVEKDALRRAGYYLADRPEERRLIGLVAGQLELEGADGVRRFVAVIGPDELWRLVAHRREMDRPPPWTYREDVQ